MKKKRAAFFSKQKYKKSDDDDDYKPAPGDAGDKKLKSLFILKSLNKCMVRLEI